MKIIISPAKQMKRSDDFVKESTTPIFIDQAQELVSVIQKMDKDTLKKTMKISDNLAQETYDLYQNFSFDHNPTPAILSYNGIQYQYMAPGVLEDDALDYLQNHLVILSGLYGIVKPFDAIVPYRLEMQTKLPFSLYAFWKDSLAKEISEPILNLASEEYAKCIRKYKQLIDVRFCEEENGKLKEKGVYAKMARGAMVRFLAENKIENIGDIKAFSEQDYVYSEENSNASLYVFIRKKGNA